LQPHHFAHLRLVVQSALY
jgi:hypothetical protein